MKSDELIHRLPRRLTMRELRVFVAVLEHRSFRKAAAVLHLSQPAITKAVASLEDLLGVRLFDRHAAGVQPTLQAQTFAPRAITVFDELRRAAQDLALVSHGAQGSLRIGITPMPAIPFLPVAVRKLSQAHPGIFMSVVEARETELLDRLRRRDIEVAILRLSLVEPGDDMDAVSLFEEKLCVICANDHRLAKRKKVTWEELLEERWVMPPADCYFFEHVIVTLDRAGLKVPRHFVETFSINMQFGMMLHAHLLSFGMRGQVEFAPGMHFATRLPFELNAVPKPIAAVTLKSHDTTPIARELIAQIRALARAH
ncbi:MAG: LysR family transcriptional regulator [Burkholderiaceae bacterium]|jgi:DNA-binding transcriptional LysR family regulator|nr:LysR family transcriptional regulator [Burkholderiaceae bacterium]